MLPASPQLGSTVRREAVVLLGAIHLTDHESDELVASYQQRVLSIGAVSLGGLGPSVISVGELGDVQRGLAVPLLGIRTIRRGASRSVDPAPWSSARPVLQALG